MSLAVPCRTPWRQARCICKSTPVHNLRYLRNANVHRSAPQRSFIATSALRSITSELEALRVNDDRLYKSLHETCKWGATSPYGDGPNETGMRRLALDDNDAKVRSWFVQETKRFGCTKHIVDDLGNIFAVRPGQQEGPPTALGSHLDTQPGPGGRYDGM